MNRDPADLLRLSEERASFESQRDALREFLAGRGLSAEAVEAVFAHVRDGIVLRRDGQPSGLSRLRGDGLLPVGESWPHGLAGRPMEFYAVIDLGEMPAADGLPETGILLFYWDAMWVDGGPMDFCRATRVFFVEGYESLEVAQQPEAGDFFASESLPVRGLAAPILGEPLDAIGAAGAESEALIAAMNELAAVLYGHQLLGSSQDVQTPAVADAVSVILDEGLPETRAKFAEQELRREQWTLLAQITYDTGFDVGDGGVLYFCMLEKDLHALRFDRVVGVMQCS